VRFLAFPKNLIRIAYCFVYIVEVVLVFGVFGPLAALSSVECVLGFAADALVFDVRGLDLGGIDPHRW